MKVSLRSVHLVGCGGSGMSGLARLLHGHGVHVTGSDLVATATVGALRELGIDVQIGHRPRLPALQDGWVIRSAAIPDDNPEVAEARRRRLPCLLYSEAVGSLSTQCRTIAVAGTHGKTSTTALTVSALRASGHDPSYLVGGEVFDLPGNGHGGTDDLFVVEACEFNRSFHALRPTFAAILNLDSDHFDCYPRPEDLEESFANYARNLRHGGTLLINEDVPDVVLHGLPADVRVIRVGSKLFADLRAIDVEEVRGCYAFTPSHSGRRLPRVSLQLPGAFQVLNALFALSLAIEAGADPEAACHGLSECHGVARRFQVWRGDHGGQLVDDYAHHPAEIRAVLATVRKAFPDRGILVAFQPHQHSRTRHLLDQFGEALALADSCLVSDIYAAREDPSLDHGVRAEDVVTAVKQAGGSAAAAGPVTLLGQRILSEMEPGSIPVVLGAGELDGVVQEVVRSI